MSASTRLKKWVLDDQIAEATAMLHIFSVENLAPALKRRRYDERVVPRQLIVAMQT